MTKKTLGTLLAFTFLLLVWAKVQSGMKSEPQVVLFFVALLTLGTSFLRIAWPFRMLFYFLFGLMVFAGWIEMGQWALDVVAPRRGMVLVDGEWKGLNGDPYWILELLFSCILSMAVLLIYALKAKPSIKTERNFVGAFIVLSAALWLVFEA